MDAHTLERLEFDKVLDAVATGTMMALGQEAVRAIRPSPDVEQARTLAGRVAEGVYLLKEGHDFGVERFDDPESIFERAAIEDGMLPAGEFRTVAAILRNADALTKTFRNVRGDVPTLTVLAADLEPEPKLLEEIERVIEPDGSVADDASGELRRIRRRMRQLQEEIHDRLEAMTRNTNLKPYLTGDYATQRSGRYVLPVAAAHTGQVPGIVHDRSDSGATAFIEPQAVVTMGNELRSLAADEGREVRRILRELTTRVREHLPGLERTVRVLVRLDKIRACARWARAHNARPTEWSDDGTLVIREGRHPILEDTLRSRDDQGELVPLDFEIGGESRTVAVTGANAGGKTVSLKTLGMLTLLAHAGLPVPAAEGTRFPPLEQVLVDIGDEQSIEANLSTFSGHVRHIREVIEAAGPRTLVLLDEVGAGTDPVEGGALACAVMGALHEAGALTVVTTHLTQVKGYVHEHEGMVNAAVAFDPETLKPTYRLTVGRPGASHALAIARRFGLPERVLETARELLDSGAIEMEGLLERLTLSAHQAEKDAEQARRERKKAETEREDLSKRIEELKKERKEALRKAADEARGLVENTRREMERALEEARSKGTAATEETRHLRRQVEAKREKLKKKSRELAPQTAQPIPIDKLDEGQRVWVAPMKREGTVRAIDARQGKVTVDAGGLDIEVDADGIQPPPAGTKPPEPKQKAEPAVTRSPSSVGAEVNLRGERYEEARQHLETYLHEAYLANIGSVRIIHGHGTGALQRMVHEFLTDFPLVENFRFGERSEGGRGVTVAAFESSPST